ncbi:MAG: GNAT family N-acetyltransferase [Pseudomonadales bacterium]|jgi:RimJ/RimL family protein N-acetyltransferase|nr:GNAT family N-acetyltransferase [Pseudomonadales bacterium]
MPDTSSGDGALVVLNGAAVPGGANAPAAIDTERLRLRPFDGSEAGWLHALDNDPAVMRWINGSAETPRAFIEEQVLPLFCRGDLPIAGTGFWKLLDRAAQEPLGWCCLRSGDHGDRAASLGYRLFPFTWGRGLASEASRALLELAFADLGLERVYADTYEENVASRRVLEKLGFALVREYRADLDTQQTAFFEGAEAFPGVDLEFELTREAWARRR